MNLRVLIADDHDLMRRGLRAIVESHPNWTVCGEARTGREAVKLAGKLRPDVAVLDVTMPEMNGLEAARLIKKTSRLTEILMLSVHYSDQLAREIIGARIRGYVLKSDSDRDLVAALEALAKHRPFYTPLATQSVLNRFDSHKAAPKIPEHAIKKLSGREREVLQLIAEGKSSKEFASILGITVKTAETHRANIMKKMNVHDVTALVRYAVRNLIIEP